MTYIWTRSELSRWRVWEDNKNAHSFIGPIKSNSNILGVLKSILVSYVPLYILLVMIM